MKSKLFILLLSLLLGYSSFAQEDWLCVYPNKKVYFEDNFKKVHCIRIDSTFNGDSIMYPFPELLQIQEYCYSINSGSWLSKYIILNEDGNTVFVNGKNQQILIKNKAALNETWEVFTDENIKVNGGITSISEESVLGEQDSVKTIGFSVYNLKNEPINHDLNNLSIKISKHFGLIKTISFYYLAGEFNLIGINEPQLGFQNLNLMEHYFDFQVGDELHIWQEYTITTFEEPAIINRIICRYLSRTDYEDSIVYYYERKINSDIVSDTVQQIIYKGELLFTTEPNEPYFDEYYGIKTVVIFNTPIPKMYSTLFTGEWQPSVSCFEATIYDGTCMADYSYHPTYYCGLGGAYWECCYRYGDKTCHDLVYYKKGDTEVGTPFNFNFLSISPDNKKDNVFSIYPNPTNNRITIKSVNNETLNNSTLEIYDIQGRIQLVKQLDNLESIDVSCLRTGYYTIKLIQKDKNITHIKFIKL